MACKLITFDTQGRILLIQQWKDAKTVFVWWDTEKNYICISRQPKDDTILNEMKVDAKGRVFIPSDFREAAKASRLCVVATMEQISLIPLVENKK
ncbi:division/cell wall cluster transcriptional repressor MraZ [Microgenomates group bacterium]|nr:division/cell wall cluster transcriptional repressor MraZ [Microgenomates group bacterium]